MTSILFSSIMPNNDPSEDDKKLFRDSMSGVIPLNQKTKRAESPSIKPKAVVRPKECPQPMPEPIYLSNYYTQEVSSESILSYHIPGLHKKRQLELKRGEIRWEGRLDLHGHTLSQTQDRLCEFIHQQTRAGHRCVLIIHGKGSKTGEPPVLKNHVNHWLKQLPQVLAFHSALPRDGGSGSVYVLLSRER